MSARRLATAVLFALLISACSDSTLSRDEAIVALGTIGVTELEATCMADSLVALGMLDAADPRKSKTDAERAALLTVSARCVAVDPVSDASDLAGLQTTLDSDDPEGTPLGEMFDPAASSRTLDPVQAREAAIDRLLSSGRSISNATCIVDHLTTVDADYLFEDESFGLGRDPFEADAFAACL